MGIRVLLCRRRDPDMEVSPLSLLIDVSIDNHVAWVVVRRVVWLVLVVAHGLRRVLGVGVATPDRAVDVGSARSPACTNADTAND